MEMDEAFNPFEVRLLGARTVVIDTDEVVDAIEQKDGRDVSPETGPFGPRIAGVAVLVRLGNPANDHVIPAMERAAQSLNVTLRKFVVRGPNEFESAFAEMERARMDAVVITDDPMLNLNAKTFAGMPPGRSASKFRSRFFCARTG